MKPVAIRGANHIFGKDQDGVSPLYVRVGQAQDGSPVLQSAWSPTDQELTDLKQGGSVLLSVVGTKQPPVWIDVLPMAEPVTGKVHLTQEQCPICRSTRPHVDWDGLKKWLTENIAATNEEKETLIKVVRQFVK